MLFIYYGYRESHGGRIKFLADRAGITSEPNDNREKEKTRSEKILKQIKKLLGSFS